MGYINLEGAYGQDTLGMFATREGQRGGVIDFKNTMYGQAPGAFLGAAGNFAYGAIASGVGISQGAAEFGAGAYAGLHFKPNFNNPFGEDNSAASNIPAGYATAGCSK